MGFTQWISVFLFMVFALVPSLKASTETQTAAPSKSIKLPSEPFYVHYRKLFPGQTRFSSEIVQREMEEMVDKHAAVWDPQKMKWTFKYCEGHAVLSDRDPIPVIQTSFAYVPIDGHHHIIANIMFGADRVPIKVMADFSDLTEEEFWEEAEKQNLVYLRHLDGSKSLPSRSFLSLEDDPNRYFASISARKLKGKNALTTSIGAEYPIWIKIGKGRPFAEFLISDALRQAGIQYTYEMGKEPPEEFVEAARKALVEAKIEGILVVPERVRYTEVGRWLP